MSMPTGDRRPWSPPPTREPASPGPAVAVPPPHAPQNWRTKFVLSAKAQAPRKMQLVAGAADAAGMALVARASAALDAGAFPTLVDDGLGGTYFIKETGGDELAGEPHRRRDAPARVASAPGAATAHRPPCAPTAPQSSSHETRSPTPSTTRSRRSRRGTRRTWARRGSRVGSASATRR